MATRKALDDKIKKFKLDYNESQAKIKAAEDILSEAERKINSIDGVQISLGHLGELNFGRLKYSIPKENRRYKMVERFEGLMKEDNFTNSLHTDYERVSSPHAYLCRMGVLTNLGDNYKAGSALKVTLDVEAMIKLVNTANRLVSILRSSKVGGRDRITRKMMKTLGVEDISDWEYTARETPRGTVQNNEISEQEWETYKREHLN